MSEEIQIKRWIEGRLPLVCEKTMVLLTGARQTGKTTLSRRKYADLKYINLDSSEFRDELSGISSFAWAEDVGVAVLDEVQKLPSILDKIKYAFDEGTLTFSVLLGSAQILLMKTVRESLAGRVMLYELWPLMFSERLAEESRSLEIPLVGKLLESPDVSAVMENEKPVTGAMEADKRKRIEMQFLRWGGMPALLRLADARKLDWLKSYETTYLERDLGDLARLTDLQPFRKVQRLAALRSACLLSYSELSRDAGVSVETVRRYLEYLRLSYQAYELQPYAGNLTSRLIKSPKLYWIDMGVLRAVAGWGDAVTGELFENYVVMEVVKYLQTLGLAQKPYFYRTRSGMEIDLLIEGESGVLGIEIKQSEKTGRSDFSAMQSVAASLGQRWRGGLVVYRGNEIKKLEDKIWAVPSWRLLG